MPKSFFRRFTKKFFILLNLTLAILFLLGSYAYLFNPKYFWPLGFLTLSAFYLVLLLVLFVFFWLFVKPAWCLISVLTIVVAYKPVRQIVPFRFSTTSFAMEKQQNELRVMSWNVEQFDILEHKTHPETKVHMLDLINEYHPDIACFQEMVGSDTVPSAINYVPDLARKLSFPDHYYTYNRKLDFDGNHHFGLIIFSKYPLVNRQTVSYLPNDYNSIFQYADIVLGIDTIRIFNIHLQSLRFSQNNLQYIDKPTLKDEEDLQRSKNVISKFRTGFLKRKTQADRIREEIDKSPYPVIVCGDFNDVPNSYAYHVIGYELKNAFVEKGAGLGRTFTGIAPTLRIDNIFVDSRFDVVQFTRVKKKMSDHFPIITDIISNH